MNFTYCCYCILRFPWVSVSTILPQNDRFTVMFHNIMFYRCLRRFVFLFHSFMFLEFGIARFWRATSKSLSISCHHLPLVGFHACKNSKSRFHTRFGEHCTTKPAIDTQDHICQICQCRRIFCAFDHDRLDQTVIDSYIGLFWVAEPVPPPPPTKRIMGFYVLKIYGFGHTPQ
jgi:hypothetical protein